MNAEAKVPCASSERTRHRLIRAAVVVGAVCLSLVSGVAPAAATHELTVGQAYYSDGTTAKTATAGSTVTINAKLGRAHGVHGGAMTEPYWFVTVGRRYTSGNLNIPCYNGWTFVDRIPHFRDGSTIPDASFVVPEWLTPGEWEVCFYSQPQFLYVTRPVTLTVT